MAGFLLQMEHAFESSKNISYSLINDYSSKSSNRLRQVHRLLGTAPALDTGGECLIVTNFL